MQAGALSHVKAVEYCHTPAGSYCAKLIADLGAEVVKVEEPARGDPARSRGPFPGDIPDSECSALFLYLNTNKLGVTLDATTVTGREIFRKLCQVVDILIEDNTPGHMDKLGLDYHILRALNPRLLVASVTPFGQTGPHKTYKAYDLNCYHAGGDAFILQNSGVALSLEEPPVKAGRFAGEFEAGTMAAVGALAALYGRALTGTGQCIDVSKQEALMQLNANILAKYPKYGTVASRATQRYDYGGMMPCKDGYVVIMAFEQHLWQGLVEMMDSPEWAKEERFKDKFSRGANREDLNRLLSKWIIQRTRDEIVAMAREKGVPIGSVMTTEEVMNYRQYEARSFFAELDHPKAGRLKYPTISCHSTESPWVGRRGAPLLGEHNEAVYCELLGYHKQDLVKMRQSGII